MFTGMLLIHLFGRAYLYLFFSINLLDFIFFSINLLVFIISFSVKIMQVYDYMRGTYVYSYSVVCTSITMMCFCNSWIKGCFCYIFSGVHYICLPLSTYSWRGHFPKVIGKMYNLLSNCFLALSNFLLRLWISIQMNKWWTHTPGFWYLCSRKHYISLWSCSVLCPVFKLIQEI